MDSGQEVIIKINLVIMVLMTERKDMEIRNTSREIEDRIEMMTKLMKL